ncbi:MAG: GGDEF domain-containing protein [Campylobacterales bacterium]|nr:GGDEF domain-containing protein [Campylobacterales bacterium]
MDQAIAHANRKNTLLSIAYLDLDGFKEINDTYGHDIGDRLLISVSHRLKEILREEDMLARLGGDEFVAVL